MQQFLDTLLNGPTRYTQSHHLSDGWTLAAVIGALLIEFGAAFLLIRLTSQNDEGNRYEPKRTNLENEFRSSWLGRMVFSKTLEDALASQEQVAHEIRALLDGEHSPTGRI